MRLRPYSRASIQECLFMPEAEFMDPKRFEALKVRLEGACGISMTATHIDPRYSLQSCPDVDATKSAYIPLFSLSSNVPGLPLFRGRWDDRASAVDVDLKRSWYQHFAFKRGWPGYRGHRTRQIAGSPWRYAISLHIPGVHIFEGEFTLETKIGLRLEDNAFHMKTDLVVSVTVVKPRLVRRIGHWTGSVNTVAFARASKWGDAPAATWGGQRGSVYFPHGALPSRHFVQIRVGQSVREQETFE